MKKVKKPASSSRLDSRQDHHLGLGVASALGALSSPTTVEGYDTHRDIDTMEARPSDLGRDLGQNDPF
jgi:hypothetical protein